jgi:hypothetical protein
VLIILNNVKIFICLVFMRIVFFSTVNHLFDVNFCWKIYLLYLFIYIVFLLLKLYKKKRKFENNIKHDLVKES